MEDRIKQHTLSKAFWDAEGEVDGNWGLDDVLAVEHAPTPTALEAESLNLMGITSKGDPNGNKLGYRKCGTS